MNIFFSSVFAADEVPVGTSIGANSVDLDVAPYEVSPEKMMRDNVLILLVLFLVFYFVLIRPQQRRVRAHKDMIKSLKKGSKVITNGGIFGTIIKFESDEIAVVEIAKDVRIRLDKSSVSEIADDKSAGKIANDN